VTVKRLKRFVPVPVERVALPRCEYDCTSNLDWRERVHREGRSGVYGPNSQTARYMAGRLMQCTYDGVVEIDGVPLCRRHAGFVVLDKYLAGEIVDT